MRKGPKPRDPVVRFFEMTRQEDRGYETLCLIWTGGRLKDGYANFCVQSTPRIQMRAHRWALGYFLGRPIGEGLHALHRCDQPDCVRGDHLFEGTHAENMADAQAKGRFWHQRRTHCGNCGSPLVQGERQRGCPVCHPSNARKRK